MLAKDDLQDLERLAPSYFSDTGNLNQIAFSLYQVTLRFERLTIDTFCSCEIHCPENEAWVWRPETVSDMSGFARLLESEIQGYQITSRQELVLTFSNDCEFIVRNEEGAYEALVITGAGGGWIVIH